ncbi:MAG: hypothetical protein CR982_05450 [Candidatus Cloacimonadota bacterium]|nr:MAG: hypothetical protein CR982_05450 [Candidatus Cloacimonadota bacterium]PIE77587.1 MAG: hypothetical protein CSA15_12175 [Candidatus Delongbacteria bacterium]
MKIHLIIDKSDSMKTLGKVSIVKNLIRTIKILKETRSVYETYKFSKIDWNGKLEDLEKIVLSESIDNALIFTDGYICKPKKLREFIDNNRKKKYIIVYCGCDARYSNKFGYQSQDILLALNTVTDIYEI